MKLMAEDGLSNTYIRMKLWEQPAAFRSFVYDVYDFVKVGD